tara:strand:+ start:400 stop:603 length:204 start_codon:yes stop_codon:yes gene_type:complete
LDSKGSLATLLNNEPIVCTENDAIKCFLTGIGVLILADFVVQKKSPEVARASIAPFGIRFRLFPSHF